MDERRLWPGTIGPVQGSPVRAPGSVRRTSTVDITWPDGQDGLLVLLGRGRDLLTTDVGADVLSSATSRVEVDLATRTIRSAATEPAHPVAALVGGQSVNQVRRLLDADGSLAGVLLDEIPVATLISGASAKRRDVRLIPVTSGDAAAQRTANGLPKLDICSGWAADGWMANGRGGADTPRHRDPIAPSLLVADDPLAWHDLGPLAPGWMRRHRRLDLTRADSGNVEVDALFRDVLVEDDGVVSIVHEYGVTAVVDGSTGVLVSIEAIPHALPGPDCPAAAASAQLLVGMSMAEVRQHVRASFRGTTTCTHLNDELRAIGDLHVLADLVGMHA